MSFIFCFFGQICSQNLKLSKSNEFWCKDTLLYAYWHFNINIIYIISSILLYCIIICIILFFKFLSIIFFFLANFRSKSDVVPTEWNMHLRTLLIVCADSKVLIFHNFLVQNIMAKFRFHFVSSKLTELHCDMLVSILIFIFPFFSALIFLLGLNYRNNIYLFEKLSISLNFKEVTQLPHCEANFANPYVTVRMLRYIKFVHN